MKSIAVLGSTGSIGKSTLKVVKHLSDQIKVKALAANSNIDLLEEQIKEFHPEIVAVQDKKKALELQKRVPHIKVVGGVEGLEEVASYNGVDFVVMAIVGLAALPPTIKAIQSGKNIGLANKEVLVSAGELVMSLAKEKNVKILPIDSEHSAIFQCLEGHDLKDVKRVILTASGGPFRKSSLEDLQKITTEMALNHPTWAMGPKITVDSSTLMNKGFEVIEAHFLFDIPVEKLEVIVHPQSIIHCLVEFLDGCVLAEMSDPLMVYPIQYALTYPERKRGMFAPFDFTKNSTLEFFPPDFNKFPALNFAFEALKVGGSFPCYLNAANEVLVERFLNRKISWVQIMERLERLLDRHTVASCQSIDSVYAVDKLAREEATLV